MLLFPFKKILVDVAYVSTIMTDILAATVFIYACIAVFVATQ